MTMNFLGVLSAVLVLVGVTDACSPPDGWQSMAVEERASEPKWIVYGTVVGNRSQAIPNQMYTVTVQPLCWLRRDRDGQRTDDRTRRESEVAERYRNITVTEEAPCHFNNLTRGRKYILFLSPGESMGHFTVEDVNVQAGAFEDPSDETFGAVYRGIDAGLGPREPDGECTEGVVVPCFTGERDSEICGGGVSVGVALWLLIAAATSAAFIY